MPNQPFPEYDDYRDDSSTTVMVSTHPPNLAVSSLGILVASPSPTRKGQQY